MVFPHFKVKQFLLESMYANENSNCFGVHKQKSIDWVYQVPVLKIFGRIPGVLNLHFIVKNFVVEVCKQKFKLFCNTQTKVY